MRLKFLIKIVDPIAGLAQDEVKVSITAQVQLVTQI